MSALRAWIESKRWHEQPPSNERFSELSATPDGEQQPERPLRPYLPASTPSR